MRFHLLAIAAILCAPAASAFAVEQAETRVIPLQNGGTLLQKALPEGNVVEFDVLAVSVPARMPNYCAVSAMVVKVWSGNAWRAGMPLALNVPCAEYGLIPAANSNDGFTPVNARSLQQSRRGIARLSDNGELIWHTGVMRQYGPWGMVTGYRVLDARMIPVSARPS
jgi:hypothetical protein